MAMSAALDVARRLDGGGKRLTEPRWAGLWRGRARDEVIEMVERRHGYFPQVFAWRGRRHDVDAVDGCWLVSRPGLHGRVERHVFRLRARPHSAAPETGTTLEIYQDVRSKIWYVRR